MAPPPISYQVEGESGQATVGSVLGDIGRGLIGGHDVPLFRLHFELTQPRVAQLQVSMNRQGVGSHAGLLLYVVPHEGGSMLVIATLPRPVKMGFGAAIDAKDFFAIADLIEAAL